MRDNTHENYIINTSIYFVMMNLNVMSGKQQQKKVFVRWKKNTTRRGRDTHHIFIFKTRSMCVFSPTTKMLPAIGALPVVYPTKPSGYR